MDISQLWYEYIDAMNYSVIQSKIKQSTCKNKKMATFVERTNILTATGMYWSVIPAINLLIELIKLLIEPKPALIDN